MSAIIGIDLGTSTSEAAFINDLNRPELILNEQGKAITPSVVYFDAEHKPIIGENAAEMAILEPDNTVLEVKRLMGSDNKVKARGREYTPQQISSFILSYLKELAEDYLDEAVTRAVITVPAYFTDAQRKATIEAGCLAGLTVERIINEPTAASLDYGILHMEECKNAIIYDLGGGTLDVTALELFEGVIDVKSTCGNNKLGGMDFDKALLDYFINKFKTVHKIDLRTDKRAFMRLRNAIIDCKIALSESMEYSIELPFLTEKSGQALGINEVITRENFEALISKLIESTAEQLRTALREAKLRPDEVDLLLLVGGSTKIPIISGFIEKELGTQPKKLIDPDLAVVRGAAIQAGIIDGIFGEKGIVLTDVCPYTLSVEALDSYFLGEFFCKPIIRRNTTVPVKKEELFKTAGNRQTQADIRIYQGESEEPERNMLLGEFTLSGIPARSAGKEEIAVEFSYDLNGILVSKARVVSNDRSEEITINMNEIEPLDLVPEIDLNAWESVKSAKKYKALIKKADKILKAKYDKDLNEAVISLKKAILTEEDDGIIELLKTEALDIIYDLENDI